MSSGGRVRILMVSLPPEAIDDQSPGDVRDDRVGCGGGCTVRDDHGATVVD